MHIANKIREVLKSGDLYTMGELWRVVNGGTKKTGLFSIGDQVERSIKGLVRRCSAQSCYEYVTFEADGKKFRCGHPIIRYKENDK